MKPGGPVYQSQGELKKENAADTDPLSAGLYKPQSFSKNTRKIRVIPRGSARKPPLCFDHARS
jgi:hypothetical protein